MIFSAGCAVAAEPAQLGGDLGGLRPTLARAGLELGLTYIGETFGAVSGGLRNGPVYDGQAGASLDADLDKLVGWPGAKAHVNAIEVHGRAPSNVLLGGNLMPVSSIEARPTIRLYTLWLEQNLFADRLSVRLGQLAADAEFAISDTAGVLVNGTFGWPLINSANMTGGGPAYPLPTPGVRVQVKPSSAVTLRAAAFNGNPGGQGCVGDPQICNPHGTTFSFSGGTLWLAELEYAANQDAKAAHMPAAYKFGAWRETGTFPDERTGTRGRRGDWGIYAIADRMVWRPAGADDRGLSLFARAGAAPADRNLVSWYLDGGFGWKGVAAARPDDVVTLGLAYGRISGDAVEAARAAGVSRPLRDQAVIELSYRVAVAAGWTVQPDLQYVIHPGSSAAGPNGRGAIRNALLLGLRTTLAF